MEKKAEEHLNMTKLQIIENPLVIMMVEEKLKMDEMKAKCMQEFTKKVDKIEKMIKHK